jgi:hypothetical protein
LVSAGAPVRPRARSLFRSQDEAKRAKFRKDMTASEIAELVVDSVGAAGAERVVATGLRPETFAGRDGFRFDLRFETKSGLEKRGFVVGAVANGVFVKSSG